MEERRNTRRRLHISSSLLRAAPFCKWPFLLLRSRSGSGLGRLGISRTAPPSSLAPPAALEADRRALAERKAEVLSLKTQSQSLPVEVDAARAADAEARSQLDRNRAGSLWRCQ